MNIYTAITIVGVVTITGYYTTAAYIVAKTGTTNGITQLANGAARILRALLGRTGDDE